MKRCIVFLRSNVLALRTVGRHRLLVADNLRFIAAQRRPIIVEIDFGQETVGREEPVVVSPLGAHFI